MQFSRRKVSSNWDRYHDLEGECLYLIYVMFGHLINKLIINYHAKVLDKSQPF